MSFTKKVQIHNSEMKSSARYEGFHYILVIALFSMNCTFNPLKTLLFVGLRSNFVSSLGTHALDSHGDFTLFYFCVVVLLIKNKDHSG